jgi:hypothetical protein
MKTRKLIGACLLVSGMFGLMQAAQAQDTGPPGQGDYLKLFNSRSGSYSYFTGTAAQPEFMGFNPSVPLGALNAGTFNAATYVAAAPTTQYLGLVENPAFVEDVPGVPPEPCIAVNDPIVQGCLSDIIMYVDGGFAAPPNVVMFSDLHPLFADPTLGSILSRLGGRLLLETGLEQDVSSYFTGATAPGGLAPGTLLAFSDVPVPAAAWLFGSALGLLGLRRRMS